MGYCTHCRKGFAEEEGEYCPKCGRRLLPAAPQWRPYDPDEPLVVAATVYGELEAHLRKGQLEQEGIPVLLQHEAVGRVYGVTVDGLGAYRLLVPQGLLQEAREALAAYRQGAAPSETAGLLATIREEVERDLAVELEDEIDAPPSARPFLREVCRLAIERRVPRLADLPEEQRLAVEKVLVHILEEEFARRLGLPGLTPEEHVRALEEAEVPITVAQYDAFTAAWQERYAPQRALEGMADSLWDALFAQAG